MALSGTQRGIARLIYNTAVQKGVAPARARELVAASYAESGLNPSARNTSSGAAGLFQLLSQGYVQRANQLGGVNDPTANLMAILPDYKSYWASHPNAAPGEAGRDVERSGEGAGFYSNPLSLLPPGFGGAGAGTMPSAGAPATAGAPALTPPVAPPPAPAVADNQLALARALLRSSKTGDYSSFFRIANSLQQPPAQAKPRPSAPPAATSSSAPTKAAPMTGLAEAFYDPLGSYDSGQFGGAIGGHSDHVHLSITKPQTMLGAIAKAQQMGLSVRENPYVDQVDPVHVKGSFHYRDFPGTYGAKKSKLGEAIDVSGSPELMAAFYRWATNTLRGGKQ